MFFKLPYHYGARLGFKMPSCVVSEHDVHFETCFNRHFSKSAFFNHLEFHVLEDSVFQLASLVEALDELAALHDGIASRLEPGHIEIGAAGIADF